MSNDVLYVTTAIPYVNGDPHVGHALELVQADVLARHRRLRGGRRPVPDRNRRQRAQERRGRAAPPECPSAEFVAEKAQRFADLAESLQRVERRLHPDELRSAPPARRRAALARLRRRRRPLPPRLRGPLLPGCEAFVLADDLRRRMLPRAPEAAGADRRAQLVLPPLALRGALLDADRERASPGRAGAPPERGARVRRERPRATSASRARASGRAAGASRCPATRRRSIYVWFDALANYVTALGFGSDGAAYRRWWVESDERLHVIGKGIVRFHAVSWPAILLSAGEPLPTTIFVHDYLTVAGEKLSKSRGAALDPARDRRALRRRRRPLVPPARRAAHRRRRLPRGARRRPRERARRRARQPRQPDDRARRARPAAGPARTAPRRRRGRSTPRAARRELPSAIDDALGAFDFRAATTALWDVVAEANRFVSATQPWKLAKRGASGRRRCGGAAGRRPGACSSTRAPSWRASCGRSCRSPQTGSSLRSAERDVGRGRTLFRRSRPSPARAPTRSEARRSARSRR